MSCFEVKVLDPNINTIEVETCINGQVTSLDIIQYDIASLEVTHCVALLPSDYETIVSGLVPVWNVLSGTGIYVSSESGIFTVNASGLQPSGNYSTVGHSHVSSDISNFNSSVSGLLPVRNILSGSGIEVSSNSGNFTVAVAGSFGLTSEEVDNRVSNLLVAGQNILLDYNDSGNLLTISTVGLQPSGNYSLVGHSHNSADISDFTTAVSGLIPPVSGAGYIVSNFTNNTHVISVTGLQPSGNYSLSGHSHSVSDISNFNNAVSGLIPPSNFSSLSGISGVLITNSGTHYYVSLSDPTIQLSGITDLSVNARTFLLTPSSTNLSTLISDETGSGSLVFNTSPNFLGVPTAPTATSGTNSTQIASTAFVRTEISNLVDSAPSTLDTLNELAAALGDDPNFATTITNTLAGKANLSGATFTGPVNVTGIAGSLTAGSVGTSYLSAGGFPRIAIIDAEGIKIPNLITPFSPPLFIVNPSGYLTAVSGNFNSLSVNSIPVSVTGHQHNYTDIINFASGIDQEISTLLVAGNYINLNYDNLADTLTINTSGLQPSGNYSIVGHTHTSSNITDFGSSISGLLPVKDILAGSGISIGSSSGVYTVTAFGVAASSASSLVTTCHNKTGSIIPKMSAVYIDGRHGNLPSIALAQANNESNSSKTYGITATQISNNSSGSVIIIGLLIDINTDQFAASEGSVLYLSPTTAGGLTPIKPTAPNHLVSVAKIIRNHVNQGSIEVNIQNGFELQELHNVAISGVSNDQFIKYDSSSSLWKNTTVVASDISNFNIATSGYVTENLLPPNITIHSNSGDLLATSLSGIHHVYIFKNNAVNSALILPPADNKSMYTIKNQTDGTIYVKTSNSETIDDYQPSPLPSGSVIGLSRKYSSISLVSDQDSPIPQWVIV